LAEEVAAALLDGRGKAASGGAFVLLRVPDAVGVSVTAWLLRRKWVSVLAVPEAVTVAEHANGVGSASDGVEHTAGLAAELSKRIPHAAGVELAWNFAIVLEGALGNARGSGPLARLVADAAGLTAGAQLALLATDVSDAVPRASLEGILVAGVLIRADGAARVAVIG
jgi:hypothetical protein